MDRAPGPRGGRYLKERGDVEIVLVPKLSRQDRHQGLGVHQADRLGTEPAAVRSTG